MNVTNLIEKEKLKFNIIFLYSFIIFISAFFFSTPNEILNGLINIFISPSVLLTDFIEVGNLGAAFFNSGLLMLLALAIVKLSKYKLSGPLVSSILTIGGFAFLGKNLYNVWAIILGVFLYSYKQKENFEKFIVVSFFGGALAPIVSQVSFGFGFNPIISIILGNLLGIIAGFILAPLSAHLINFHKGFNLYNVGFTAGIIATMYMSTFRIFGLNTIAVNDYSTGNNNILSIYFLVFFISMLIIGLILNGKDYKDLISNSGHLKNDFIKLFGIGLTLFNMGLLGLVSVLYVILIKADFNGPVIGGILTLVGFGAFGKHIKNTVFIIIGVNISAIIAGYDLSSTPIIISGLFGTCLAPISGRFGWKYGVLAGMLHLSIVLNTGALHGGMNLYNNGFSAGIVAAIMVPLIKALNKENL